SAVPCLCPSTTSRCGARRKYQGGNDGRQPGDQFRLAPQRKNTTTASNAAVAAKKSVSLRRGPPCQGIHSTALPCLAAAFSPAPASVIEGYGNATGEHPSGRPVPRTGRPRAVAGAGPRQ